MQNTGGISRNHSHEPVAKKQHERDHAAEWEQRVRDLADRARGLVADDDTVPVLGRTVVA